MKSEGRNGCSGGGGGAVGTKNSTSHYRGTRQSQSDSVVVSGSSVALRLVPQFPPTSISSASFTPTHERCRWFMSMMSRGASTKFTSSPASSFLFSTDSNLSHSPSADHRDPSNIHISFQHSCICPHTSPLEGPGGWTSWTDLQSVAGRHVWKEAGAPGILVPTTLFPFSGGRCSCRAAGNVTLSWR